MKKKMVQFFSPIFIFLSHTILSLLKKICSQTYVLKHFTKIYKDEINILRNLLCAKDIDKLTVNQTFETSDLDKIYNLFLENYTVLVLFFHLLYQRIFLFDKKRKNNFTKRKKEQR